MARGTSAGLAVKGAGVLQLVRVVAERDGQTIGQRPKHRARWLIAMDVLMGVEMGLVAADQFSKRLELALDLRQHDLGVVEWADLIQGDPPSVSPHPFVTIDMQTDVERGPGAKLTGSLPGRRPAHREAHAGHDPFIVGRHAAGFTPRLCPKLSALTIR
jgi:hypothetical protein